MWGTLPNSRRWVGSICWTAAARVNFPMVATMLPGWIPTRPISPWTWWKFPVPGHWTCETKSELPADWWLDAKNLPLFKRLFGTFRGDHAQCTRPPLPNFKVKEDQLSLQSSYPMIVVFFLKSIRILSDLFIETDQETVTVRLAPSMKAPAQLQVWLLGENRKYVTLSWSWHNF